MFKALPGGSNPQVEPPPAMDCRGLRWEGYISFLRLTTAPASSDSLSYDSRGRRADSISATGFSVPSSRRTPYRSSATSRVPSFN
jgi:hypothetical protein